MDFSRIKQHCDAGRYRDPVDFLADCNIIYANARAYNPPGSDCYLMANTLEVRARCAHTCTHAHTHTHTHTHTRTHMHAHSHMHGHTHTHMRTHARTGAHVHAHTYMHANPPGSDTI